MRIFKNFQRVTINFKIVRIYLSDARPWSYFSDADFQAPQIFVPSCSISSLLWGYFLLNNSERFICSARRINLSLLPFFDRFKLFLLCSSLVVFVKELEKFYAIRTAQSQIEAGPLIFQFLFCNAQCKFDLFSLALTEIGTSDVYFSV